MRGGTTFAEGRGTTFAEGGTTDAEARQLWRDAAASEGATNGREARGVRGGRLAWHAPRDAIGARSGDGRCGAAT
jgi:hypothetical protein